MATRPLSIFVVICLFLVTLLEELAFKTVGVTPREKESFDFSLN